jgi:hypothetical protein
MGAPTPESLSVSNTEHGHQAAIFCHFAMPAKQTQYPELKYLLFAVPNGGLRDKITAARLKTEGVKSGTADIICLVPKAGYHGFVLELKKLGEKKRKPEQVAFIAEAKAHGFCGCIVEGWELAVQYLEAYLNQE